LGSGRGRRIDLESRELTQELIGEAVATGCRLEPACELVGLSARTLQRWEQSPVTGDQRRGPITVPSNKLTPEEKAKVVSVVTSPEFRDDSPSKIVPRLADQGIYLASESTIYRILKAEDLSAHRSKSRPATHHRPEPHEATGPNQVWSWDITYLPTMVAGIFFYLYLIMDIYSRKIVGFEVHDREAASLSSKLIEAALKSEGIDGKELVLHADNGAPMKGATMLVTLQNLGVIPSFSRPSVSDDNPYSEALFKTTKYCQLYPSKPLPTVEAWREWVTRFAGWYGDQPHSGIKFVTPNQRHRGEDFEILAKRKRVYENAKLVHPCRWSGDTRNWDAILTVKLNPLIKSHGESQVSKCGHAVPGFEATAAEKNILADFSQKRGAIAFDPAMAPASWVKPQTQHLAPASQVL
jgi:putative transposase